MTFEREEDTMLCLEAPLAEIISDLEESSDDRELLPEELDAVWRPIWNVAQRQLGRGSKRGKA